MCWGCYEEYGSPDIENEKTRLCQELILDVYEFSCVGGNLHVVLDDWNLEDSHIKWCLNEWIPKKHNEDSYEQIKAEIECGLQLLKMSLAERASTLANIAGYR